MITNGSLPHGWDLGDEVPPGVDLEAMLAGAKTWTSADQEAALVELEARLAADAELDEGGDDDGTNDEARHRVGGNRNYELSDTGNAKRLVDSYGDDLRYVPEWKKWLVWKDGQWRVNIDREVWRRAIDCTNDMLEEGKQNDNKALIGWAGKKNHARLSAMVDLASIDERVILHVEKIDANPMMLGVKNGVIDLQKHVFRAAKREDYITKRCNVNFEPSATCPRFEEFVLSVLPEEMIPYIQRAFGYCLTGLVGEEVLFLWWGHGANGKSTLRETIFELMGDYVIAADATLLIERKNSSGGATPEVARLHGKRLVTINETSKGDVLNEARVKFITGQDTITARNLYEGFFDFKPTHKTIPATNYKPIVKGLDEGIWRRIHLWPFLITIPKEDETSFLDRSSWCRNCRAS